jgi:hypothetical protein
MVKIKKLQAKVQSLELEAENLVYETLRAIDTMQSTLGNLKLKIHPRYK